MNTRKKITVDEYIEAVRKKEVIIREFEMLFKEVDFLLSPSVQIRPPIIGQETTKLDSEEINVLDGCTKFTRSANLTGMPALVIPFGFSSDSLPLSIQLMAPRLHETKLLKFASSIEKATPNLRNKTPRLN